MAAKPSIRDAASLPSRLRESRAGRIALGVIIAVACLWLGRSVLTQAMADYLAEERPEEALVWEADHPGALVAFAGQLLKEPQPENLADAEALSVRALAADPLEMTALRTLGLAAVGRGDGRSAFLLMEQAGRRSRRDVPTQAWLVSANAARDDYDAALRNADALVRSTPTVARQVYPAMAAMADDPKGLQALARTLAANPPWRRRVVDLVIASANDPQTPGALLALLDKSPAPSTVEERAKLIDRLVKTGQVEMGFVQWVSALGPEDLEALGNVYDGEFNGVGPAGPFNWTVPPASRGAVEFAQAPGDPDGRALRLMLTGEVRRALVQQQLVLAPGAYEMRGEASAEHFDSAAGLQWAIRCGGKGDPIAATVPLRASAPRHAFAVAFRVPAQACADQVLSLEPVRDRTGAPMLGEVWFDRLRITPAA